MTTMMMMVMMMTMMMLMITCSDWFVLEAYPDRD